MSDTPSLLTAPSAQGATISRRPVLRDSASTAWMQSFLEAGPIDVSVCIANWNCRDLLRACLESLHDYPQGVRLETIVVDNASADGAADMVAREFPEVILIRNPSNRGFSHANNQAARRATGEYLFFLNNDTVVPEGTLGRLLDFAAAHPEAGLIGPRLRDGNGQTQVSYRNKPTLEPTTLLHRTTLVRWTGLLHGAYRRYRRDHFDANVTRPVEVLMGAAMFMPRQAYDEAGGWDEDFTFGGEDLDLSLRVGLRRAVVFYPDVEITHYGRVSTRRHIGFASRNMIIGFARYLRKSGCSEWGLRLYKTVITLDTPLHLLTKAAECVWRRLHGRRQEAEKSWLVVRGLAHFLASGLPEFWRA